MTPYQKKLQSLLKQVEEIHPYQGMDLSNDVLCHNEWLIKCPVERRASLLGALQLLMNACPEELGGFELTFRKKGNALIHIEILNDVADSP